MGLITVQEEATRGAMAAERADLRVALVHYWLVGIGGGEKVLDAIAEIFPQADIFTLIVDRKSLPARLRDRRITASFLQSIPGNRRLHRHLLPLYPLALEQFDLRNYDLVISSESGPAKGVISGPQTCHICYCHSPMRYIWDMYHEYCESMNPLTRRVFSLAAHYARVWDVITSARVDHFVANSQHVAARIRKYYRRESAIIHPPVDVAAGHIASKIEDYYLVAGRLVAYKRVAVAIEACKQLRRKLRVVGEGPEYKRLTKLARPDIEFLGKLDESALRENYAHCRALLFPGEEDFGMVPVEVQSYGRPVIAYGKGGALESIVGFFPGEKIWPDRHTGVFFSEQTVESLKEAILAFEAVEGQFSSAVICANTRRFDAAHFKSAMTGFVSGKLEEFRRVSQRAKYQTIEV